MPQPLISICIPAYKRIDYLQRLLHSVQAQTYASFEVIITDDSPDESVKKIVDEFSKLPISYFKNNPPTGTPGNWNNAIKKSKGEWIKLMHDDDWFARPDALEQFASAAQNGKADFIFSACTYIHENGRSNIHVLKSGEYDKLLQDPVSLVDVNVIGHPSTVLHKRDAAILYNPAYKWVVDIDFYMRYLQQHKTVAYLNQSLINIGVGSTQVSNDCYKNPFVEIPEYLSLLSNYPADLLLKNKAVFRCIWNLVKKFRLKNGEEVKRFGYEGQLPEKLDEITGYQKRIPRIILKQTPWSNYYMQKAFVRLSQGLYK